MSLPLDIGQGAGIAGATGVRPFLPALVTGALAKADAGIDFDGTDYSFLESPAFLLVILVLAVALYALDRRGSQAADRRPQGLQIGVLVVSVVLGGLFFAGSLAAGGETSWWGLPAGVACAALGYLAIGALFGRARARLEGQKDSGGALALLDTYAELIALVLAVLAVFADPVGYVALAAFLVLIARTRGERGQKYGGLRILR